MFGLIFFLLLTSTNLNAAETPIKLSFPKQDVHFPNGQVLTVEEIGKSISPFLKSLTLNSTIVKNNNAAKGQGLLQISKKFSANIADIFEKEKVPSAQFKKELDVFRQQHRAGLPGYRSQFKKLSQAFNLQANDAFKNNNIPDRFFKNLLNKVIAIPSTSQEGEGSGPTTFSWYGFRLADLRPFFPIFLEYNFNRGRFNFTVTEGDRGSSNLTGSMFSAETISSAGIDEHSMGGVGAMVTIPARLAHVRVRAEMAEIKVNTMAFSIFTGYATAEGKAALEVYEGGTLICRQEMSLAHSTAVMFGAETIQEGYTADDHEHPYPWAPTFECEGSRPSGSDGVVTAYMRMDSYAGAVAGATADVTTMGILNRLNILAH